MVLATKLALDDSAFCLEQDLLGMIASHINQLDLSVASALLASVPSGSLVDPTPTMDSASDLDRMDVVATN